MQARQLRFVVVALEGSETARETQEDWLLLSLAAERVAPEGAAPKLDSTAAPGKREETGEKGMKVR